jgi:hypothetical protein
LLFLFSEVLLEGKEVAWIELAEFPSSEDALRACRPNDDVGTNRGCKGKIAEEMQERRWSTPWSSSK